MLRKHLFAIFLLYARTVVSDTENIIFAAVIYRHGARTPILFVDDDPCNPVNNGYPWPVEMGQLTNEGKLQHYRLGKWLKTRYSGLLSSKYVRSEIYIRSTDLDRTIMSAQSNLAGMYPPTAAEIWNDKLPWQPIPVHTVLRAKDELLAMRKFCPAYDQLRREYVNSTEYEALLNQYHHVISLIREHIREKTFDDMDTVRHIYDTWNIEQASNLNVPDWARDIFPDAMRPVAALSFVKDVATRPLAILKVGPLIREIAEYMNKAREDHLHRYRKVSVYSAHDSTVARVLHAMGLTGRPHSPPYTATILMELLKETNQTSESRRATYTVRIMYRNSSEIVEPIALQIPGCDEPCPLDQFCHIYSDFINVNWNKECEDIPK